MGSLPKLLIGLGVMLILVGVLLPAASKIPFLGKLPGDIYIRRNNFSFYFPLTTGLIISVFLTLFFSFWGRR